MARVADVQHGMGGMVLISGESGVGKSRLMLEIAARATDRGVKVLFGHCLPDQRRALGAFHAVFESIADHCREEGMVTTDRILAHRGRVLAQYFDGLAALPGQAAYANPAELPAGQALTRLYHYLWKTLTAFASNGLRRWRKSGHLCRPEVDQGANPKFQLSRGFTGASGNQERRERALATVRFAYAKAPRPRRTRA
ncbi:MAG: AAA family ATPase, partial [Candidatus Schekmanbacteria bacterium]|nr:AAA family ATPase [Candidatus Schekmanbacteria bacterium]